MKIRPLSDLHEETRATPYPEDSWPSIGEDVVILAGDISSGCNGIRWAAREFGDREVLYVLGNHEFYQGDFDETLAEARKVSEEVGISLLENDAVTIAGVRFLGCTLWTDFDFFGSKNRALCMEEAGQNIRDFRKIRRGSTRLFMQDVRERSLNSQAWLKSQLDEQIPTVVITHFAPTGENMNPRYAGDLSNSYFYNHLESLVTQPVLAWIHGHTHFSATSIVNGIPIISNQRGYPGEQLSVFQPDLIIDIEPTQG